MQVQCKCPNCGRILQKEDLAMAHKKGFACPKCRIKLLDCNGVLVEV
jgi:DNA-directed RNA polymerase subunit RPC12/RpoP